MRTFTLFGQNISYTASPAIQHAALAALGLDHRYVVRDVAPEEFAPAVAALRGSNGGANVTIPHKSAAAALVDELSADAALLGAVNTIVVDGERLIGHNTDLPAILDEVTELLGELAAPVAGHRAVIMGAGGASRAVAAALTRLAIPYAVVQRSDGTLPRIAEYLAGASLLVNTTPVGTASAQLPLDPALLRPDLAVFDLTYRPSPTALVAAARLADAPARTGGGMLVGQAWRSLALWLAADGIACGRELAQPMLVALGLELGSV